MHRRRPLLSQVEFLPQHYPEFYPSVCHIHDASIVVVPIKAIAHAADRLICLRLAIDILLVVDSIHETIVGRARVPCVDTTARDCPAIFSFSIVYPPAKPPDAAAS